MRDNIMKLLIICLTTITSFIMYAQKAPLKAYEYSRDSISIRIEVADTVYNYNDSVSLKIIYKNNSHSNVYFFDLIYGYKYESSFWNAEKSSYVFNFGGNFWIDLGKEQFIGLHRIEPNKKRTFICKQLLDKRNKSDNTYGVLTDWLDGDNIRSFNSDFYFAYIIDTGKINMEKKDRNGGLLLHGDEESLLFDKMMQRVYLGPICLRLRN
jgi:hypothetical protein